MRCSRFPLVLLLTFLIPALAGAEKLQLNATSTFIFEDFVIVFEDTGDGLLQHEEILYFSGTSGTTGGSVPTFLDYTQVLYVPAITGISTASGTMNPDLPCAQCWELAPSGFGSSSDGWFDTRWTYAVSPYSEPSRNMTFSYEFMDTNGNAWG